MKKSRNDLLNESAAIIGKKSVKTIKKTLRNELKKLTIDGQTNTNELINLTMRTMINIDYNISLGLKQLCKINSLDFNFKKYIGLYLGSLADALIEKTKDDTLQ